MLYIGAHKSDKVHIPKQVEKRIPKAHGSNPNLGILLLVIMSGLSSPVFDSSDNPGDTPISKPEVVAWGEGQRLIKKLGWRRKDRRRRRRERERQGREGGRD